MTGNELFKALGGIDPELILDAAPKTKIHFPRRLAGIAASLVLLFCLLWAAGFDNVYAGMRELFSFIPGVGIQEAQGTVYTWEPVTRRLEQGEDSAQVLRASYVSGDLAVTVEVVGQALWSEQFRLFVNGELTPLKQGQDYYYSLATADDASMLDLAIPMAAPQPGDLFEIEVDGFEGRLAFTLTPCETYEQLQQIGPTVTKNGISLTTTAQRIGNELVVWCYDTRWDSATQDTLVGIGQPANSGHSLLRYLETESGVVPSVSHGWSLLNRMVFQLADTDKTAILHIPYLAMYRKEAASLTLQLPETEASPDAAIQTSLGTIRVVSVRRSSDGEDKDQISIRLAYDNAGQLEQMYSISYKFQGGNSSYFSVDSTDGTVTLLNVTVDKGQTSLKLSVSGIYYYLMDEYVIPLELAAGDGES